MKKIGIIGYGVVGKAIDLTLASQFETFKFDKFSHYDPFEKLLDTSFIFISVPTPYDQSTMKTDDSAVRESLRKLDENEYSGIVIVKSTLALGSSKLYNEEYNLRLVFNPEFLRESLTPDKDFKEQDTVVIGSDSSDHFYQVKKMYEKVLIEEAEYFHTSFDAAEMVKLAQNAMLASRVALANIIFDSCESYNIDYSLLRKIAFDRFDILGPHMVQVPGPDGKRGFGGKCLPKDISAFSKISDSEIIKQIINYNKTLRDDLGK